MISRQAVLMSLCLQSMVEELLREKDGKDLKKGGEEIDKVDYPFTKRDGTVHSIPVRVRETPTSEATVNTHTVKQNLSCN